MEQFCVPKYIKVKGRDKTTTSTYAGHLTPAGAKVVPGDTRLNHKSGHNAAILPKMGLRPQV